MHYLHGTLAWNHTVGGTALNEARFGYNRFNYVTNYPQTPALPSSSGFNIVLQFPDQAGLPVVELTGYFTLGFSTNGPQPRIDQTYQFTDNFSKIHGNHSFKMGFEMRTMQVYNPFLSSNSGHYTFGGAGSLLHGRCGRGFPAGIPDQYGQNSGDIINARSKEFSAYFQDQYKVRPNLTMTYGVNWQMICRSRISTTVARPLTAGFRVSNRKSSPRLQLVSTTRPTRAALPPGIATTRRTLDPSLALPGALPETG